ncbi:MAG: YhcH/YjgK/YiaL family protein [Oscillospiraceae bacterium]
MICARNGDARLYRGIHPNLDLALEHITPEFLSALGTERVALKGEEVYCTKFTYPTVPDEESFFEAHQRYLDIHIMLEGSERIEIASPAALEQTEARPENDFWAYRGTGRHSLVLAPGEFLVVFPDDAHKLKMQVDGPRTVTKAVFKIKLFE